MRVVAEETGAGICLGGGAGAASGEFHITVCERGTYAIEKEKKLYKLQNSPAALIVIEECDSLSESK